jgi:hypothetical protein
VEFTVGHLFAKCQQEDEVLQLERFAEADIGSAEIDGVHLEDAGDVLPRARRCRKGSHNCN